LNNNSIKYQGNDDSNPDNLLQNYNSRESEIKFRAEDYSIQGKLKINYGINLELARYNTQDYTKFVSQEGLTIRNYNSLLTFMKWGAFGQVSGSWLNDRLSLSIGLRTDANNYSDDMNNMSKQLSPRLSASYSLSPVVNVNFNTGIYYQLPAYTVLGYRDSQTNDLVNKTNDVTYIKSSHIVGGLEFNLKRNSRVTVEGFYKYYDNYPFLLEDSISLANLGADFGVIGNAPVKSISIGKSYGLEFLFQQKLYNGFYGLVSYTWVRSEFQDKVERYVSSAWDNKHLVSLTGGKKFGKNWELGLRWLFTGGAPYTPYNVQETVRIVNWDIRPYGLPDYDRLNTDRVSSFHQLDIRLDKKYYFTKWSLDLYFDVQNVYNHVTEFQDNIDVVKDATGNPIENPDNPGFYIPKFIQSTYGNVLPTIGIIIEL
jgi:hypothetical protein